MLFIAMMAAAARAPFASDSLSVPAVCCTIAAVSGAWRDAIALVSAMIATCLAVRPGAPDSDSTESRFSRRSFA